MDEVFFFRIVIWGIIFTLYLCTLYTLWAMIF